MASVDFEHVEKAYPGVPLTHLIADDALVG